MPTTTKKRKTQGLEDASRLETPAATAAPAAPVVDTAVAPAAAALR